MQMTSVVLVTRPDHDVVTKYLSVWSEEVIQFARKRATVYELIGKKVTRNNFESYIKSHSPSFLFLNGHGNANEITGYNNETILDKGSKMKPTIIYARSCEAARVLGRELVSIGSAKAFIGYQRNFICGYSPVKITRPMEDPIAPLFLEPSNLIVSAIIKGNTVMEAHLRSRDAMYRNFRRMISSAATYEERYAARWLWSNLTNQVLLGDADARM
jgi:hypothetical protein